MFIAVHDVAAGKGGPCFNTLYAVLMVIICFESTFGRTTTKATKSERIDDVDSMVMSVFCVRVTSEVLPESSQIFLKVFKLHL